MTFKYLEFSFSNFQTCFTELDIAFLNFNSESLAGNIFLPKIKGSESRNKGLFIRQDHYLSNDTNHSL